MESFCCPRCVSVSWSPADVAAGYCGSCREVTRIEGLDVALRWRAGEWECKSCGTAYVAPHGRSSPPLMCTCGRPMEKRLHAQVTIAAGGLSERSRREAEWHVGSRAGGSLLSDLRGARPLRSLEDGGAAWYERAGEQDPAHGLTGRDYYRLARTAECGPQDAAERARALLDRMRCTPPSDRARSGPESGWTFLGTSGGEMFWAQADLTEFSFTPQLSYEEPGTVMAAAMQNLAGLSVSVSGAVAEQMLREFLAATGMRSPAEDLDDAGYTRGGASRAPRDLGPIGAGALAPEAFSGPPDRSLLGALDEDQIDEILARNQTVMDDVRGLILNHSAPGSDVPRPDVIETWSPGHP